MRSIEDSHIKGKRRLDSSTRKANEIKKAAEEYRLRFLRSLKPEHPLYQSAEARAAKGEPEME